MKKHNGALVDFFNWAAGYCVVIGLVGVAIGGVIVAVIFWLMR